MTKNIALAALFPRILGGAHYRLLLLSTAAAALTAGATAIEPASAQTAPDAQQQLPTVVVQSPQQRPAPRRVRTRIRTAAPARRPISAPPQRQTAESEPGTSPVAGERGTGPVAGTVARQSVSATKTDTPIVETPQSISVVTREQIEAQQPQTLQQSIAYTPSASIETNGGSSHFDYVNVRGLDAPQYRDGLRLPGDPPLGFARWRTEPYGLERIEVLRGPSSGVYGQGSPGGIVSMVSKRPTETPFYETALQTGSYGRLQGAFDFSGPVDAERKLLYRITGLARTNDAEIDFNGDSRVFIAPAFTWRPNADTSFTFLSQYQKDDIRGQPQQYIPAYGSLLPNPNGHISRSLNVGDPNTDRIQREQFSVGYAFEHRFNDVWQVRQNLRYASVDLNLRSMRGEGLLGDLRTMPRSDFTIPATASNFTVDNQLQADFATGPLKHKLLMGIDYSNLASTQQISADFAATPIDIFAPVYTRIINPLTLVANYAQSRQQVGLYAQDQVKFGGWILTLTGRQDFAETQYTDKLNAAATTKKDSSAFTGRAALGYLFDNGLAPYVSYATSFDPVSGADQFGNVFVPTTGESIEGGIKYQPTWLPRTLFAFAAFDIKQKNLLTPDPDPAAAALGFQVQTGEVSIRGVEFEARTNPFKGFNLVAAVSWLDATITQSNNPAEIGKRLAQVPRNQASLWADYTFQEGTLAGFGLGAGVRYVGTSFSDSVNTAELRIPSYALFDAALYYDFGYRFSELKGLKLDVTAKNLADKEYVAACYGYAYCNYGAGRQVLATLRYRWDPSPATVLAKY